MGRGGSVAHCRAHVRAIAGLCRQGAHLSGESTRVKPLPRSLESLPGTRPEGTHDEREAAARVQEMFGRIAPRYDFLNHLLSFSLDKIWRRRTARQFLHILRRPDARILDLCCGTGDLAFALDRARSQAIG